MRDKIRLVQRVGAFCRIMALSGVWAKEEAGLHINLLELEAVVRALTDIAQGRYLTVSQTTRLQ